MDVVGRGRLAVRRARPQERRTEVDRQASRLRVAIAEVSGSADSQATFVDDFVAAWVKVMELDRFAIA